MNAEQLREIGGIIHVFELSDSYLASGRLPALTSG
jgi:hypothetical protein